MILNVANSDFHRMIYHRIHRKEKFNDTATMTPEADLLGIDEESIHVIKSRINAACGKESKAFKLEIAQMEEGSFFSMANDIRGLSDDEFIQRSIDIAELLAESQRRINIPGGYLLVIDGTDYKGANFLIVIKAELHEAFIATGVEGSDKKSIELIKDIFLSPDAKFFKIGILKQNEKDMGISPNDRYSCLIFDEQYTSTNKEPAEYFVKDFLGFSTEKNTKITTKRFYWDVHKFVFKEVAVEEVEERDRILSALRDLYLHRPGRIINPREFADENLTGEIKDKFYEGVLSQDRYLRPFEKDPALLKHQLKNKIIPFPQKVKVEAPEEVFEDRVTILSNLEEMNTLTDQDLENYTLVLIKGKPYQNG